MMGGLACFEGLHTLSGPAEKDNVFRRLGDLTLDQKVIMVKTALYVSMQI